MGAKVTVDSATLMNKGLEVIEAMWLFDVGLNQIEVAVHPQSIVHSMVEFADGSVLAQMGRPDMRLPILYALSCPNRVENPFSKLDIYGVSALTFEKPNRGLFPCLGLAESAAEIGGNMPGVLNAANEAAVNLFLEGRIGFTRIPLLIEKAMSAYTLLNETNFSLETAVYYSEWALRHVNEVLV
jgi:1-deoxy-D-xylulose-5-phosphate reductoisomerase